MANSDSTPFLKSDSPSRVSALRIIRAYAEGNPTTEQANLMDLVRRAKPEYFEALEARAQCSGWWREVADVLGVTEHAAAARYEGGLAVILVAIVARQENAVIDFKAERDEYESQKLEDDEKRGKLAGIRWAKHRATYAELKNLAAWDVKLERIIVYSPDILVESQCHPDEGDDALLLATEECTDFNFQRAAWETDRTP